MAPPSAARALLASILVLVVRHASATPDCNDYHTEPVLAAFDAAGNLVSASVENVDAGTYDRLLTLRYSPEGRLLWARQVSSPRYRRCALRSMAAAPDGTVYVAGYGSMGSDGGEMFLVCYSPQGVERWLTQVDTTVHVVAAASGGRVVVAGESIRTYNASGELLREDSGGMTVDDLAFDGEGRLVIVETSGPAGFGKTGMCGEPADGTDDASWRVRTMEGSSTVWSASWQGRHNVDAAVRIVPAPGGIGLVRGRDVLAPSGKKLASLASISSEEAEPGHRRGRPFRVSALGQGGTILSLRGPLELVCRNAAGSTLWVSSPAFRAVEGNRCATSDIAVASDGRVALVGHEVPAQWSQYWVGNRRYVAVIGSDGKPIWSDHYSTESDPFRGRLRSPLLRLADDDRSRYAAAIREIAGLGINGREACPRLSLLIADESPEVREGARKFLEFCGTDAVPWLEKRLYRGAPKVRIAAEAILGSMGTSGAKDALAGIVKRKRLIASGAASILAGQRYSDRFDEGLYQLEKAGPAAVPAIVDLLFDMENREKRMALIQMTVSLGAAMDDDQVGMIFQRCMKALTDGANDSSWQGDVNADWIQLLRACPTYMGQEVSSWYYAEHGKRWKDRWKASQVATASCTALCDATSLAKLPREELWPYVERREGHRISEFVLEPGNYKFGWLSEPYQKHVFLMTIYVSWNMAIPRHVTAGQLLITIKAPIFYFDVDTGKIVHPAGVPKPPLEDRFIEIACPGLKALR